MIRTKPLSPIWSVLNKIMYQKASSPDSAPETILRCHLNTSDWRSGVILFQIETNLTLTLRLIHPSKRFNMNSSKAWNWQISPFLSSRSPWITLQSYCLDSLLIISSVIILKIAKQLKFHRAHNTSWLHCQPLLQSMRTIALVIKASLYSTIPESWMKPSVFSLQLHLRKSGHITVQKMVRTYKSLVVKSEFTKQAYQNNDCAN